MQKRRSIPLFSPRGGRMASVCLVALFSVIFSASAFAKTDSDGLPDKRDYNKDVRTGTWSIYVQGGLSWATGVSYESINAKKSYGLAPAIGGGVDYTIRPWVRVGAEYLWSRYRREQRFSQLDVTTLPAKAYGNFLTNYHNVKLGADFNVMEFWPRRQTQWLNIWLGTGLGGMFASGNEYGIYFNNTITQDGVTTPITDDLRVDNDSSVSISSNVLATNSRSSFNKLYIPLSLHVEFDVARQFTLGVKGGFSWVLNRQSVAPKNLALALVTFRYNFVPGKAKKQKAYYDGRIAKLDSHVNTLQRRVKAEKARANKATAAVKRMESENADLQRRLKECGESREALLAQLNKPTHVVQFENNSSDLSDADKAALTAFAERVKGKKLSMMAEASTPGTKQHNQRLSERRLQQIIKVLKEAGVAAEDISPAFAVGEQRGLDGAEARRVKITVE